MELFEFIVSAFVLLSKSIVANCILFSHNKMHFAGLHLLECIIWYIYDIRGTHCHVDVWCT